MIVRKYHLKDRQRLKEIFFETSTRVNFSNECERESFFQIYLGHYLDNYFEYTFVLEGSERVLGYICACPNSYKDSYLYEELSHYGLFEDLYTLYPAHLHINLTQQAQGKGGGGKLIEALITELQKHQCQGIHLITAPTARNRSFYLKNYFQDEYERQKKLFMGRRL